MPYDTPYNRMIAKIENRANEDYAEHNAYSNQMYNTNRPFSEVYAEVKLPERPFLASAQRLSNHDGGITGVNGEGYCGGAYISHQMRHSRLGEDTRRPLFSAESASEAEESESDEEQEGAGGCYSDEEEETENRIIGMAEPMKCMPVKELVKEHKGLVKVLEDKSPKHMALMKKEASKQKKELKSYEKKLKGEGDKRQRSPSPPPPSKMKKTVHKDASNPKPPAKTTDELADMMSKTKITKRPSSGSGASGGRKPSKWIEFVKKWAVENKMKYGDALRSPKLKADYAKHKTGGFAFLPILASALAPLAVKGVKSLVNKIRGNGENKSGGSVMGGPANDPVNRGKITGLGKKKGGKIAPDANFYPPTGNYHEGASLGAGKKKGCGVEGDIKELMVASKKGRGKAKKTGASLFLTPSVQPTDVKATPTVEDNIANLDEYVPVAGNGKRKRRTKKQMAEAKEAKEAMKEEKKGGMLKSEMPGSSFSGGAKKSSAWIDHVKAYAKKHKVKFGEALKLAGATYKK